jgi:capsular exopolysaccharide synthesis family protein
VIENELGSVDKDISSYKSDNLILDIAQAGSLAMGEATESAKQEADIAMRIGQLRITYEYLSSATDDSQQIPLYSSIENGAILQRISEYNKLVLERNSHQSYSSAQNPLVVELNKQLAIQRKTIIDALSNEISTLQTQQNALRATHRDAIGRVARNPQQANYLLSVERQQKVKESLYLFLLQKREENELSQAFTAYNTQLIEPAHGSWDPVEPVSRSVYLMALILGLALPAVIIFLKEMLTTTVQGREDFKNMQIPFAGVIPQSGKKNRNKKKSRREPSPIVVKEGNRDMMNEAFRVIRSNLEFLLGHDASHKVIMLTSIDPGSGKTFITANLANTISLKEKKVLAIDLDLRRASLSACVKNPSHGISGYLAGRYQDYHELIVKLGEVDMLPCGALPPNPSELLYSDRFAKLMESVRQEYDYVFLDCPPLEIVADPAIINRYSDLTLFVARCGVLEKSLLPEIDEWYLDKKFNNMVVLLNGADANGGHYGYHHYGYHSYGYHSYGYYGSKS